MRKIRILTVSLTVYCDIRHLVRSLCTNGVGQAAILLICDREAPICWHRLELDRKDFFGSIHIFCCR